MVSSQLPASAGSYSVERSPSWSRRGGTVGGLPPGATLPTGPRSPLGRQSVLLIIHTEASLHWGGKLRGDHLSEDYFPVTPFSDTTQLSSQEQKKVPCQAYFSSPVPPASGFLIPSYWFFCPFHPHFPKFLDMMPRNIVRGSTPFPAVTGTSSEHRQLLAASTRHSPWFVP